MDNKKYYYFLPKIELHAHLNGSLSMETFQKLKELKQNTDGNASSNIADFQIEKGDSRTLSQCFALFGIAQALTDTPKAVKLATKLTLEEFAEDNVVYMELRSTPRENENMTKRQYVKAMVDAVVESTPSNPMITGIIISIDRRNTVEQARSTLEVAIEMHRRYPNIVLGLDLSGDPTVNSIDDFVDILQEGRNNGLKITVHTAEVPNDLETKRILEWGPDRIGHATCVPDSLWDTLLRSQIPIEICLTSNVKCKVVESYNQHHFKKLYQANHPLCLSTDDKGVFSSNLTDEYVICAETFELTKQQMYVMTRNTCEFIFTNSSVKKELKELYDSWWVKV